MIIDGHTAQLDQLKVKVEKANSTKELIEVHAELKKIVVDINLETRYYMGIVLNHRIDNFIIKSDNVSINLTSAIQKLKEKGNDTTNLEKEFADFQAAINKAKESQSKTKELFTTHKGFADDGTVKNENDAKKFLDQGNKLQRDTIRYLKQAGNQVIKFVKDLRNLVVNKGKEKNNHDEVDVIGRVTTTVTTGRIATTPNSGGVTSTFTTGGVTSTQTTTS
jgi:hypothetical protein